MNSSNFLYGREHALGCELAEEVLLSCGTLQLKVMGWSMLPTLWPGDILEIQPTETQAVCEGDIVLFRRDRRLFVHRVVGHAGDEVVRTRGDAMPQADPPVSSREIVGKIVSIRRHGKVIAPVRERSLANRSVAKLVVHSETAARAVVAIHEKLQGSASAAQDRVVSCQQ